MIGELGGANEILESLSNLGVRLALDDFGTGYSTLAHLQRLRTDVLKIDRSFISQLGGGTRDAEIIGAVTAMAHALGMTVVGEGIETHGQRDNLAALDCDEGQGYVLARPMPPAEVAAVRAASQATPAQSPTPVRSSRGRARRRHGVPH